MGLGSWRHFQPYFINGCVTTFTSFWATTRGLEGESSNVGNGIPRASTCSIEVFPISAKAVSESQSISLVFPETNLRAFP